MIAGKCPRCGKRVAYTIALKEEVGCVNCSENSRELTYIGRRSDNPDISVSVRYFISPEWLILIPIVYTVIMALTALFVR